MATEIDKRISEAIKMSDTLRAATEKLREEWSEIAEEAFSILLRAGVRPLMIRAEDRMFRVDWVNRELIEARVGEVIVDVADMARFGNLAGGENESVQEQGGSQDVSGIASTY
jgi:predicted AAA+ superfamily ATPase